MLLHYAVYAANVSISMLELVQDQELNLDKFDEKGCSVDIKNSIGKTPIAYGYSDENHFNTKSYNQIVKKLIIAEANLKDEIGMIVNKSDSILSNYKLYEKVTVLTNLIYASYSLGHSDTSKMMYELEKAQNDVISYLHKKIFDRREQIKLCEKITQFQSKAKLIKFIKP